MALGEASLNSKAQGDKVHGVPTAFSMWQEHGDRCDAIRKAIGVDMRSADPADQFRGVDWELRHAEKPAGAALQQAVTPEAAATALVKLFERPRDTAGAIAKRTPYATFFAAMFVPASPAMSAAPASPATPKAAAAGPVPHDLVLPKLLFVA